jgi:hypothetical protein
VLEVKRIKQNPTPILPILCTFTPFTDLEDRLFLSQSWSHAGAIWVPLLVVSIASMSPSKVDDPRQPEKSTMIQVVYDIYNLVFHSPSSPIVKTSEVGLVHEVTNF